MKRRNIAMKKAVSLAMAVAMGITSVVPAYAAELPDVPDTAETADAAEETEAAPDTEAPVETEAALPAEPDGQKSQPVVTETGDLYMVILPNMDNVSYHVDDSRVMDLDKDFTILTYTEGEAVSFSVDAEKDFHFVNAQNMEKYEWAADENGSVSFSMPAADVALVFDGSDVKLPEILEADTEESTEAVTETESETETSAIKDESRPVVDDTQSVTESEEAVETETVPEETEAVTEAASELTTEEISETETEILTENESETEITSEAETELISEAETESETNSETEPETEDASFVEPLPVEVTQRDGFDSTIPDYNEEITGPEYTICKGDTSFSPALVNLGYDPAIFNIELAFEDQNVLDVNTIGDYVLHYEVTNIQSSAYTWKVTATIHVVEQPEQNGLRIHVASRNLTVNGASYGNDVMADTDTLNIKSVFAEDINPVVTITKDGTAIDSEGLFAITTNGNSAELKLQSSFEDGAYVLSVSDETEETYLQSTGKLGGGWMDGLEDQIESVNGTVVTLNDGTVFDVSSREERAAIGDYIADLEDVETYDSADNGIALFSMRAASSSTTVATKKFQGKAIGTHAVWRGYDGNYVGDYDRYKFTMTDSNWKKVKDWLKEMELDDGKKFVESKIDKLAKPSGTKGCIDNGMQAPNGNKYPSVTATVKKDSNGKYTLKLSFSRIGGGSVQRIATYSKSYTLATEVVESYGKLSITKSTNGGTAFTLNPNSELDTTFTIAADENFENVLDELEISGDTKEKSRTVVSDDIDMGGLETMTVYVKETERAPGHTRNEKTYTATLKKDETVTVDSGEIVNYIEYGIPEVKKESMSGEALAGAIFKFEFKASWNSNVIRTWYIKSDKDGVARLDKAHLVSNFNGSASDEFMYREGETTPVVPVGCVTVTEVQAPENYLLDSTPQNLIIKDSETTTARISLTPLLFRDKDGTAQIQVEKHDADTGSTMPVSSDKDANGKLLYSLEGAQYTIYSDSKLGHAIETLTIGSDGRSNVSSKLRIGTTYYVKETKAPSCGSYEMNDKVYPVSLGVANATEVVPITVEDKPKYGSLKISKSAEGTQLGPNEYAIDKLPSGIKFRITNKAVTVNGKWLSYEGETNEKGELLFQNLPFGNWEVEEIASEGNKYYELSKDTVLVDTDKSPVEWKNVNKYYKSMIKIQKKDKVTGNIITRDSTEFKLVDASGKDVTVYLFDENNPTKPIASTTFKTDEQGEVELGAPLHGGKYKLVEINPPAQYYTWKDGVDFEITKSTSGNEVFTVEMSDAPITGTLTVQKKDAETKLDLGAGFEFTVYAAEDILDGAGKVYPGYTKDSAIFTMTTDESGLARAPEGKLYIGKYYVKETKTADGYTLNPNRFDFDVVQAANGDKLLEEAVPVEKVVEDTPTTATILKIAAEHKEDAEDYDVKQDETQSVLEGVTFRVKAKDADDADNQLYVTDKDGQIKVKGLKLNTTYVVYEVETLPGYNLSTEVQEFTVDGNGLINGSETIALTFENDPNRVVISKTDITTAKELPGATLVLTREDGSNGGKGSEIETWVSTDKPHMIKALPKGTYRLTETSSPAGYEVAESITFEVVDTLEIQKVTMKDHPYKDVPISKKQITGDEELPGATLQIFDAENNPVAKWDATAETPEDQKYEKWVSTDKPYLTRLASGVYTLVETRPADGYVTADSIVFRVSDKITTDENGVDTMETIIETGTEVDGQMEFTKTDSVVMRDDTTKVTISKKDITNGEEIPGAKLEIKDENGNVVESWTSTDEPHYIEKLPIGKYTLSETTAPDGYETTEDVVFEVKDTGEIQHTDMFDSPYRDVEISKRDITNSEEIAGAELVIKDESGTEVAKWISGSDGTNEDGKLISHKVKLPAGKYTLSETLPADGYVTADDISFEVIRTSAEDYSVQTVEMYDDHTKVEISKKDITNEKELEGAKLEIKDKDGNVIESWTSGKEPHYIEMLPIGKYTLTETTAPNGYDVAETVNFEVKDTAEIQHVIMYDSPTQKPGNGTTTPKTGDVNPVIPAVAAAAAVLLAACGVILSRKKKKSGPKDEQ